MCRWRAVLAALLVVITAGGTGCAVEDRVAGRDPAPRAVDAATRAAFHTLVVQPAELGLAEAVAIRSCLRAAGYAPPRPRAFSGSSPNLPAPVPVDAARVGFGDTVDRLPPGAPDVLSAYAAGLAPGDRERFAAVLDDGAASRASFTTPAGWTATASTRGCVAQARTAVYGSVDAALLAALLPQDTNEQAADVDLDPRATAVTEAYRRCMSGRGLVVRLPQDAAASVRDGSGAAPREPTPAEVTVAVADAACRDAADLMDTYVDVLADAAAPWIAANAPLVREAEDVLTRAVPRAEAILAADAVSSPSP